MTLRDGDTEVVEAPFVGAAVRVKLAVDGDAESELAQRPRRAIDVGHALVGWNWKTRACDATQTVRAIRIGHAAIGDFADVVVTDHAGERTILIGLTRDRRRTTARSAHPQWRTFGGCHAIEGYAVSEVAAFTHRAI